MNSKLVMLVSLGLVLGGVLAAGLYFLYISQEKENETITSTVPLPSPTPTSVPILIYENPSGFSFEYPVTVEINESDDDAEYASLELTSENKDGKITIQVADTNSKSTDEWIEDEKIDTKDADVSTVPFADIDGVQTATPGGILTVSVDYNEDINLGAAFIIHVDWMDAEDFWQDVYDTIMSTFSFITPEQAAPPPASSGGGVAPGIIFEGEEIIE